MLDGQLPEPREDVPGPDLAGRTSRDLRFADAPVGGLDAVAVPSDEPPAVVATAER